jgi:hypothetical protein
MKTKKLLRMPSKPSRPPKNRITLIYCYLLCIYMLCKFFELITIQIASRESKRAKQRWICIHQSQKCHITWCPSVLHEPYLTDLALVPVTRPFKVHYKKRLSQ